MPITATALAGTARPVHEPDPDTLDQILDLAADPMTHRRWERQAARVGYCAHPIRLRGHIAHADTTTGEVREVYTTDDQPGQVLLTACGNRRAARCPACAETYRADAYQLLRAGLAGGKGIPTTVREHPAVFATFTAPSFGPVHTIRRTNQAGRLLPCRPRRHAPPCPHGRPTDCRRIHPPGDPNVGEPLCVRCYAYDAHVLWNALAGKLWSRTTTYLQRALAAAAGLTPTALGRVVRIRFAKVAEYQARGVIHFHAVIRLDATPPPGDPGRIQPPAPWFTTDLLAAAIRHATATVTYPLPNGVPGVARWGTQLDLRPITHTGGPACAPTSAAWSTPPGPSATVPTSPPSSSTPGRTSSASVATGPPDPAATPPP